MRLTNPTNRFPEVYKIYEEAFPSIERRTKEGQRAVLDNPHYQTRVMEEDGRILAFVGYWDLPGCLFLEHLATTEECRGKGYGKLLVEECIACTDKPVFLEIEPIAEKKPMTGRRAGFYERIGFHVNSFAYEQMPLKAGDQPIPLWVMSYENPITEEAFLPYKKEIYEIVYGVRI